MPGTNGMPARSIACRARVFDPMASMASASGTNELYARVGAGSGELCVLGKKSVTGMDGVCSGSRGDVENLPNVEIRLGCRGRADGVRLIGLADVQRSAIHVRIDGNSRDSHLVAGADNAYGNLAAIGDENFLEHLEWQRRLANTRFYKRFRGHEGWQHPDFA